MKTRYKFWAGVYALIFFILLVKTPELVLAIITITIVTYMSLSWMGYDRKKKYRAFGDYNLVYLIKVCLNKFNKWLDTFDKENGTDK